MTNLGDPIRRNILPLCIHQFINSKFKPCSRRPYANYYLNILSKTPQRLPKPRLSRNRKVWLSNPLRRHCAGPAAFPGPFQQSNCRGRRRNPVNPPWYCSSNIYFVHDVEVYFAHPRPGGHRRRRQMPNLHAHAFRCRKQIDAACRCHHLPKLRTADLRITSILQYVKFCVRYFRLTHRHFIIAHKLIFLFLQFLSPLSSRQCPSPNA